ncbi:MAG: hypothetical protein AUJ72_03995 [Candidatus Omnitrophica bacterium CG1_02_46_14]|nr:MAG: hypothetical protein AUJ72_03995 [Candidatus Omnitrophica bacterium CG1_02_46_14]
MKSIYRLLIASPPSRDRKELEAYFASQPYELMLAADEAEVMRFMAQGVFDLFILDVSTAEIDLQDNGPGIPPEELENIFRPFYQIDKNRTGNIRGTGLGLAIVQYLVVSHGGEIRARSGLGQSTIFSITLPLVS